MVDRPDWPTVGRWLGWGALGMAVFAVVAVATVVLLLNRSIERVDVDGLGEGRGEFPSDSASQDDGADVDASDGDAGADDGDGDGDGDAEALTVLVLGSDSRESLTPEERQKLGTGDAPGERTEVIMLVRLDPDADDLRVLSIPRDTLITRCDGSRGRINAAYAIGEREDVGGPTCVVQTLRNWYPITIDHVAMVDFLGFVDIVDAVGGVPIELDQPISDENANLDLEAGCTRLDGEQALAFVRARGPDNDFGRMRRQLRFIEELRREIASVGILDDPPRFLRTANAVARATELDRSLTLNRIRILAQQHRDTLRLPVEGRALPGEIDASGPAAFLIVDDADVREGYRWLVTGAETAGEVPGAGTDDDDATNDDAPSEDGAGLGDPDDEPTRDADSGGVGAADERSEDGDDDYVATDPSPGTAGNGSPPC